MKIVRQFRLKHFKMPAEELPEEFLKPIESPSNSSLSSNSSDVILINAHYVCDSRSASISSNTTSTQDDSFEGNVNTNRNNNIRHHRDDDEEEEVTYQPIKLPTEPTLEELLVRFDKFSLKVFQRIFSFLSATSDRQWRHSNR